MRNKVAKMKPVKLENAFLMIEKGPVVLISTSCRGKNNIMPLSWITVIDFTPRFADLKQLLQNSYRLHL